MTVSGDLGLPCSALLVLLLSLRVLVSVAQCLCGFTLFAKVFHCGEKDSERDSFLAPSNRDGLGMTPSMLYKGGTRVPLHSTVYSTLIVPSIRVVASLARTLSACLYTRQSSVACTNSCIVLVSSQRGSSAGGQFVITNHPPSSASVSGFFAFLLHFHHSHHSLHHVLRFSLVCCRTRCRCGDHFFRFAHLPLLIGHRFL